MSETLYARSQLPSVVGSLVHHPVAGEAFTVTVCPLSQVPRGKGVPSRAVRLLLVGMPTLPYRVLDVLSLGTEEEVIRPDALPVVAVMTDIMAGRDLAVLNFPRQPVCKYGVSRYPETPILACADPLPAPIRPSNLRPEPLNDIHSIIRANSERQIYA